MRLRIISGTLKGRFIQIPEHCTQFRPTLERTRQSVAEIIKSYLPNAIVADLCAGSGAFGFEMISRGANRVDFVEKDRKRADILIKNYKLLGVEDRCRCIVDDVRSFVKKNKEKYDVVYYDPPYNDFNLQLLIPDLLNMVSEIGILVYERQAKQNPSTPDKSIVPFDVRIFGDTIVEFYRSNKMNKEEGC